MFVRKLAKVCGYSRPSSFLVKVTDYFGPSSSMVKVGGYSGPSSLLVKVSGVFRQLDVVLVLDLSSLADSHLDIYKSSLKRFISESAVEDIGHQFSLVSYGAQVDIALNLTDGVTTTRCLQAVDDLLPLPGGRNTHLALAALRETIFLPESGDREGAINVVILITSGPSFLPFRTLTEANLLKESGVTVFSLGVGRWVKDAEVQFLASKPASYYSKRIPTVSELGETLSAIVTDQCTIDFKPKVIECAPLFDIAFIMDASSTMSAEDFRLQREFVDNLVSSFDISPQTTRAALVAFNNDSRIIFNMATYSSYSPIKKAIFAVDQTGAGRVLDKSMRFCRNFVFRHRRLDSSQVPVPQVLIIITGGKSRYPQRVLEEANLLKEDGVTIFTISVSNQKQTLMSRIASQPATRYNFNLLQFSQLYMVYSDMVNTTCKEYGTKLPEEECHGLADIMFFYDVPQTDEDLGILRSYMETIVRYLEIAENATRVALTALHHGGLSPITTLEQNLNQSEIFQALLLMRTPVSTEKTTGHFLPNRSIKWRDDVIKIVVLFRFGLNHSIWRDLSRFVTASYRQDILRFVINVGNISADISNRLASEPKASHVVYAPYMDTLMTTAPYLLQRICDGFGCQTLVPSGGANGKEKAAALRRQRNSETMRCLMYLLAVMALACQADRTFDIDAKIREIMNHCGNLADVAFILDASSSIKPDDYETMKDFIKNMIKSFEVSQDRIRIAIISFNQFVSVDLYLDQATDGEKAIAQVDEILATNTGTNTHKALHAARTMVFQPSVGDRPTAPNIAIVLTDGQSTHEEETRQEAKKLKNHDVTVFSIGVGKWLSDQELQVVASRPTSIFSYRIDSFGGLDTIRESLKKKTCISPPRMPDCDPVKLDIAFILDASSSISSEDFQKMKEFVDSFISSFEIFPSSTRIALIAFDLYSRLEFNLNDYDSYNPIKNAIYEVDQRRTGTATHKALEMARTEVFSLKREDGKAKKIAVVLTDGKSREPDLTEVEAANLKDAKVIVFAVGVGKSRISELEKVASKPNPPFNIHVTEFDQLQEIFPDMVAETCKDKPDQGPVDCDGTADLMFLVEIPSEDADYELVQKYMEQLIDDLDIGQGQLRVAVTLFAKKPFPVVTLPEEASKPEILASLRDFELPSKRRADLANGFSVLEVMADLGWRRKMSRIVVSMFIDSPDKSLQPDVLSIFQDIKKRNLESIVVNIGKPWEEGAKTLASDKEDIIFVPRFDALSNTLDRVKARICDACGFRGDIVFLIDASSSITQGEYDTAKGFVKQLMSGFNISDDQIRVGLVVFNQFVNITYHLNKITEPGQTGTSLRDLVDTVAPIQVGTFTHKALKAVREEMLTPDNGDRPDVPNIVIVLTDGQSRKPEETVTEAAMLREAGTLMFAISVGRWRSDTELQVLASKPASQYTFAVETFDGLETIRSALSEKTCQVLEKPPKLITECFTKADILFVIDGSKSISPQNFETAKTFVAKMLDSYIISPEYVRVAVMTFDQKVRHGFYFNTYEILDDVKNAVQTLEQYQVGTFTHKALEAARKDYFNPINGEREDAPNIIILLTDGRSRKPEKTLQQADITKSFDITLMTIGIGNSKIEELESIATVDGEPLTFSVHEFDQLVGITSGLVEQTCKVKKVEIQECSFMMDFMFVLDLSSSVGEDKSKVQDFVSKMADGYEISDTAGRIGFITFNSKPYLDLKLSEGITKEAIKTRIDEMREPGVGTMTWKALDMLREQAYTAENGARPGAYKVAIILSDGKSRNVTKTIEAAKLVRAADITTFVVTVGKYKDEEIKAIASEPADFFTFSVEAFDQLFSLLQVIKKRSCEKASAHNQPQKRLLLDLEALVKKLEDKRGFL
ncbi:collagen alpha-3(VI) chain-like [Liolophura sinensis]|uniref:collagen alpha-3(VI) chain-like n=1 Tax=Liolophura sinensis TaxID=3198878 RepID=UPI0031597D06